MPVIRTKPAAAKPAPAKRTVSKTAKPKATPAKAPAKRTAKAKAKTNGAAQPRQNRSPKTDMTAAQLKRILGPVEKAATARDKAHESWKGHVATVNEGIVAALDAEVPVNMIVDAADVSRQHVYKIISDLQEGKRTPTGQANGTPGRKPVAKAAASRTTAKSTPASTGTAKRAAKTKPATVKRTIRKK